MAVGDGNLVVYGSQVRGSCDKIDVEVGVVILLKLDWVQSVASQGRWGRELCDNRRSIPSISGSFRVCLILAHLNLHTALRDELGDLCSIGDLLVVVLICRSLQPIDKCAQICGSNDKREMGRLDNILSVLPRR